MNRSRPAVAAAALTAVVIVSTLAACAADARPGSGPSTTATDTSSADAALEEAVLPVLTEQMDLMQIPGLVAIVQTPDRGSYEVALGMSGFQTQATRRESDGTVIVVLTNITQAPDLQLPATTLSELISRAIPAA